MAFRLIAPFWELWLAKLLGRKFIAGEGTTKITTYHWRGHIYVARIDNI